MTLLPNMSRLVVAVAAAVLLASSAAAQPKPDLNELTEKAMKVASAKVAPSIVKIVTVGGTEVIGVGKDGVRKGVGPTTGLIVSADGYIISSAFNFANKPTAISVSVPGRPQALGAKIVASDQTRMLALLKIDAQDLPVPEAFPKKEVEIGQWGLSLGRTLDTNVDHPPSMSVGIVSAVNRVMGKMIQTDAKTSPVNYGGPLVAVDGRVYGVIVPSSSRGEGETAGVEWYDGGIGFAVPLEDVLTSLPRLKEAGTRKEERDRVLRRGLLGITPQGADTYNAAPVIGAIQPDSAASRAGLAVGDKILEINGKKVPNYSTLQHVMGPLYEGDEIAIKVQRGDKETDFKGVKLTGTVTAYVNAFLGVLPMRDEPGPGVEVRYVYPKSPADAAGIKAGDRVMKVGVGVAMAPVQNRAALMTLLQRLAPGTELKVELKRKEGDKVETVTAKLVPVPEDIPEKLPLPSSAGKALEGAPKDKGPFPKNPVLPKKGKGPGECGGDGQDEKKGEKDKPKYETGLMTRTNPALGREYWLFVPDNYDANVSHGLIVWFHPVGEGGKDGEKMMKTFRDFAEENHFIVMGPKSGNKDGWLPSETELVVQDVKTVLGQYTVDRARVAAHGMGNGGQMAFYVGFNARDTIRGVATLGAVLGNAPKDNVANQPLSFFIAAGDKDPLFKDIVESKDLLKEKRFPVVFREMKESGKEYYDLKTFNEFLNWLESLDRI